MQLRVAIYQMPVSSDIPTNSAMILKAIDWAASQQAEILLTPEGSLSGYSHLFDTAQVEQALADITRQARCIHLGLALGTCFYEPDGRCYNQIRFYRPDGEYLGSHSKTLCCGDVRAHRLHAQELDLPFDKVPFEGEVNHFAVAPLRTFCWNEQLTIGGLICNDFWANPEATPMPDTHLLQQLAEMGAQVVFHAVNGGRNGSDWSRLAWTYHEANLRMRARTAGVWVVTADNAAPEDLPCSAPTGVIDPEGNFVCRAEPQGAQYLVYTIDLPGSQIDLI